MRRKEQDWERGHRKFLETVPDNMASGQKFRTFPLT